MAVSFHRGQKLTPQDIYIVIRNQKGYVSDVKIITFDIYYRTDSGVDVLMEQDLIPSKDRVGHYYAVFPILDSWQLGEYYIRWKFQYDTNSEVAIAEERFSVEDTAVLLSGPSFSPLEVKMLKRLRNLLRDNNPERNYHFRPPVKKKLVNSYTTKFGFIWEDEELVDFIHMSIDWINMYPPATTISIEELTSGKFKSWQTMIIIGAAILAITAVTLNWVADEFSYSISGVSLDLEKSSKYLQLRDTLEQQLENMITQAKSTIKISVGLRNSRFSAGFQSGLFGPYTSAGSLSLRNMLGRGFGAI